MRQEEEEEDNTCSPARGKRIYAAAICNGEEKPRGRISRWIYGDERGTLVVGIKEGWRRREFTERDGRKRGKK